MKPPILLVDGLDLMVFEAAQAAEAFVEPPDVADGAAYDAEGRLLGFETDGRRTFLAERESEPMHGDELRSALLRSFEAAGIPCGGLSLPELVSEAVDHFQV